jgi:antitoxin component YwqK of YwqJK toxin-antitoxin module
MRKAILIILILSTISGHAQQHIIDDWSIPDTIDLGIISMPDSLTDDDVGGSLRLYVYVPVSYNLPKQDSLHFNKIVGHRANTVAHQPKQWFKGKGVFNVKVKTNITVDRTRDEYVAMSFQSNRGLQVCRIMYHVIGLDQLANPTTGPNDGLAKSTEITKDPNRPYDGVGCVCPVHGMTNPLILIDTIHKYIKKKHPNGNVWEEGMIVKGRGKHGEWLKYHRNGNIQEKGNYNCGKKHGLYEQYDLEGNKLAKELYNCGNREGKSIWYYENGKIKYSKTFKKNKLDGAEYRYSYEGVKMAQLYYKNGLMHGTNYTWTEKGQLKTKIEYSNGLQSGLSSMYYSPGNEKMVQRYIDYGGKELRHGVLYTYYKSGKPENIEQYAYGNPYGKHIILYENGDTASIKYFEDGKLAGNWREYFDNGQIRRDEFYLNGEVEGKAYYYNDDGSYRRIEQYRNGQKIVLPLNKMDPNTLFKTDLLKGQIGFFGVLNQVKLDSLMDVLQVNKTNYSKADIKRKVQFFIINEKNLAKRKQVLMKLREWEQAGVNISAVGIVGKLNKKGKIVIYTNEIEIFIKTEWKFTESDLEKLFSNYGKVITFSSYGAFHSSCLLRLSDDTYNEAFDIANILTKDDRVKLAQVNKYYQISPDGKFYDESDPLKKAAIYIDQEATDCDNFLYFSSHVVAEAEQKGVVSLAGKNAVKALEEMAVRLEQEKKEKYLMRNFWGQMQVSFEIFDKSNKNGEPNAQKKALIQLKMKKMNLDQKMKNYIQKALNDCKE